MIASYNPSTQRSFFPWYKKKTHGGKLLNGQFWKQFFKWSSSSGYISISSCTEPLNKNLGQNAFEKGLISFNIDLFHIGQ